MHRSCPSWIFLDVLWLLLSYSDNWWGFKRERNFSCALCFENLAVWAHFKGLFSKIPPCSLIQFNICVFVLVGTFRCTNICALLRGINITAGSVVWKYKSALPKFASFRGQCICYNYIEASYIYYIKASFFAIICPICKCTGKVFVETSCLCAPASQMADPAPYKMSAKMAASPKWSSPSEFSN